MSRIGNNHIDIPANVEVTVNGAHVTVKGPKGQLEKTLENCIEIKLEDNKLTFVPLNNEKHTKQMHGTTRAVVANMVKGVVDGYEKVLKMEGAGYRAELKNGSVVLYLGYSHTITMVPPEGITYTVPNQLEIHVSGISKELVGQCAAEIRAKRGPEPYKGKGLRYSDEVIRRKEVKKAGK